MLVVGGNEPALRMMVALEYMKGKSTEEIAKRLPELYQGSNGFKLNGIEATAWFDEQCIHIARGKTARFAPSRQVISWQEAAERIGKLLESGEYATNVELVEAPGYERTKVAESLWYLVHDLSEAGREQGCLASLHELGSGGFPDATKALADKLADGAFRSVLMVEYQRFLETYRDDPSVLRFHYHKLERLEQQLEELSLPLREYHTDRMMAPIIPQFITNDEINESLCGGSGFSGGKARIYAYWQSGHSAQDKANFLKNEYGTGGHSHALSGASGSGEDHDAKGIRYTKPGCDKVQLSWSQVATRIDDLVKQGRYFDKDALEQYQQEKQAVQKNQRAFDAYNEIKEAHPDDIVLYQVGDFFEMYGEDAKIAAQKLAINLTTRLIPDVGRVDMCGIPSHTLEQYTELLRESHGVTISAIAQGETERKTYTMPSINHEAERAIDAMEAEFGADGSRAFGSPTVHEPEALEQDSEEDSPFVQQVMRDAEAIASEEESYERFSVIETEKGYAIWDDIRNEIYVDEQGVREEFTSEWQANDYLQEVKKAVSEKEAAEWLYVEQSKLSAEVEADVLTNEEFAAKYLIPGQTVVEMDDRTFRVESVDLSIDKVELRDVTFANAVGFPIFRVEHFGTMRHLLEQQMESQTQQPDHFIHHYYVVEDLQVRGALQLKEYGTFEEGMAAYQSLPTDKIKALGVQNTRTPLPGSLDLIQCKDGQDTLISDYEQVDGWQNPEILEVVAKLNTMLQENSVIRVPAENYVITDDNLGEGGAKLKYVRNVAAIRTLFALEEENRTPTLEEQEILANYVGWGGLADAFDPNKPAWAQEYANLKNLLPEREYEAARASALNAHFTSPTVIRAI